MRWSTGDYGVLNRAEAIDFHGDDVANGERRWVIFFAAAPEFEQAYFSAGSERHLLEP
jgi:hypothetical protein